MVERPAPDALGGRRVRARGRAGVRPRFRRASSKQRSASQRAGHGSPNCATSSAATCRKRLRLAREGHEEMAVVDAAAAEGDARDGTPSRRRARRSPCRCRRTGRRGVRTSGSARSRRRRQRRGGVMAELDGREPGGHRRRGRARSAARSRDHDSVATRLDRAARRAVAGAPCSSPRATSLAEAAPGAAIECVRRDARPRPCRGLLRAGRSEPRKRSAREGARTVAAGRAARRRGPCATAARQVVVGDRGDDAGEVRERGDVGREKPGGVLLRAEHREVAPRVHQAHQEQPRLLAHAGELHPDLEEVDLGDLPGA